MAAPASTSLRKWAPEAMRCRQASAARATNSATPARIKPAQRHRQSNGRRRMGGRKTLATMAMADIQQRAERVEYPAGIVEFSRPQSPDRQFRQIGRQPGTPRHGEQPRHGNPAGRIEQINGQREESHAHGMGKCLAPDDDMQQDLRQRRRILLQPPGDRQIDRQRRQAAGGKAEKDRLVRAQARVRTGEPLRQFWHLNRQGASEKNGDRKTTAWE